MNIKTQVIAVPPFVNMPGFERLFAMTKWKAYDLIKEGKIRAKKAGRDWIIDTASVLEYIDALGPIIPDISKVHLKIHGG